MAHVDLIRFVAAASTEEIDDTYNVNESVNEAITGEEAKTFYENIVNVDSSNPSSDIDRQDVGNICNESCVPFSQISQLESCETEQTNCDSDDSDCNEFHSVKVENPSSYIDLESDSANDRSGFSHRASDNAFVKKHNQLLGFAQNGALEDLKKLFRDDLDVNIDYQDQYGWTALMCAAVAQQLDVVKWLLSKGANKFILNCKDKNVFELCEESGAIDAKIVINTYNYNQSKVKQEAEYSKPDHFYCDTCKAKVCESTFKQHSTSTAHLFNSKLKPKSDQYMIPESNRGFQLMKKSGWDGQKGLGPEGQGYKYPVKTFLKRDRKCLGTEVKMKTKVTHFGSNDANAVKSIHHRSERKMSIRAISKRERKRREQKARNWEKNLRTYMNIDL